MIALYSFTIIINMYLQELLAFTHDILHAKATENIRVEFEGAGGSSSAPQGKKTIPHKENCVFKRSKLHTLY